MKKTRKTTRKQSKFTLVLPNETEVTLPGFVNGSGNLELDLKATRSEESGSIFLGVGRDAMGVRKVFVVGPNEKPFEAGPSESEKADGAASS